MSKQSRIRTQELRQAQLEAAARKAKQRRIVQVVGGLVILGLVVAIVVAVINATGGGDRDVPRVRPARSWLPGTSRSRARSPSAPRTRR